METLHNLISDLRVDIDMLNKRVAALESENAGLRASLNVAEEIIYSGRLKKY